FFEYSFRGSRSPKTQIGISCDRLFYRSKAIAIYRPEWGRVYYIVGLTHRLFVKPALPFLFGVADLRYERLNMPRLPYLVC
ncbi:hypothetical protein, partial [Microcoleus sp. herbarium5]|uniref:hypothetical protein n=1 Tax=Microcoleus sp. herbarium5 TaxID=3055434 RepID=UPI002FD3F987